eukprot:403333735
MNIISNQQQHGGISGSQKQNSICRQNEQRAQEDFSNSTSCLELKLKKLSNSSRSPDKEIYQMNSDSEDNRIFDCTDSNCGSPDTRMDSQANRCSDTECNLYNLQDGDLNTEKEQIKLCNSIQLKFSSNQCETDKLLQSPPTIKSQSSNHFQGLDNLSSSTLISPFNFENIKRFSGKIETQTFDKINQKVLNQILQQNRYLDEVIEEDPFFSGQLRSDHTDESSQNKVPRKVLQIEICKKPKDLESDLKSCRQHMYQHSSSTNTIYQNTHNLIQSTSSNNQYEKIQERIFNFFDEENIQTQAVGEVIREINCSAFKGMSKLSPLKLLDLSKSPLRRHRANTMQL